MSISQKLICYFLCRLIGGGQHDSPGSGTADLQEEIPMGNRSCSVAVRRLMQDEMIRRLLAESNRRCVLHRELASFPPSSVLHVDEAWSLVREIRRHMSITMPVPSPAGHRLWYFTDLRMSRYLQTIDRYCRPESPLHQVLISRQNSPFIVRSEIEEAIAASKLDGLDLPYENAASMLHLDRAPRSASERLLWNAYRASRDIEQMTGEPFSPGLLLELYRRLNDRVDRASLVRSQPRLGLVGQSVRQALNQCTNRNLELICSYANDAVGDDDEHPAIRATSVRGSINRWQPLPDWNGNVASLAFRLYCLKKGYPVLSHIPLSRAVLEWEEGIIAPPDVIVDRLPTPEVDGQGFEDHSVIITLVLQLIDLKLRALQTSVAEKKRKDEELIASLQADFSLNHRQRSILSRAVDDPTSRFSIRYHRALYGISYATARSDLLDMTDKGLLQCELRDRAFIFRPHHDLERWFHRQE